VPKMHISLHSCNGIYIPHYFSGTKHRTEPSFRTQPLSSKETEVTVCFCYRGLQVAKAEVYTVVIILAIVLVYIDTMATTV
jgi:hypothetical protein